MKFILLGFLSRWGDVALMLIAIMCLCTYVPMPVVLRQVLFIAGVVGTIFAHRKIVVWADRKWFAELYSDEGKVVDHENS